MRLATILALALAMLVGAYAQGRHDGRALEAGRQAEARAATQAALIRAAEQASRIEAARLALEAERDALARDLEDQAHADPDATGGLPVGRVERLRRR